MSLKTLAHKLLLKDGHAFIVLSWPQGYLESLTDTPGGVTVKSELTGPRVLSSAS